MRKGTHGSRKNDQVFKLGCNDDVSDDVCSYIPQIADNLAGIKGNPIQQLVAAINCTLWVVYGLGKKQRDLALATANFPGIIFGLVTFITAL